MTSGGLHASLNSSENQTLHQDLNMTYNIAESFTYLDIHKLESHIVGSVITLMAVFGLVGNGIVLWFLCFCLKGDAFIFIANLAVADFGVLFAMFAYYSMFFIVYLYGHSHHVVYVMNLCLAFMFCVTLCASTLFLAAISADRCVAVFFPLWHRCHRPGSLSTSVSALLWALAAMVGGVMFYYSVWHGSLMTEFIFFFLSDSFMVFFMLTLLIRAYCYSDLCQNGRLLKVVLLSLFVFIVTLIPQNFVLIFIPENNTAFLARDVLICLNSSANPFIYFFVGRLRSGRSRRSVKVVLKKLFHEDEDYEGQTSSSKSSVQTT